MGQHNLIVVKEGKGPSPQSGHKLKKAGAQTFSPGLSGKSLAARTYRGSRGPIFLGASLADFKRPSAELFSVQAFDGCAAFRFIAHGHECETTRLAGFSIGYDLNLRDTPKLFKDMPKVSFSDGERNISNVELHVWWVCKRLPAAEPFP